MTADAGELPRRDAAVASPDAAQAAPADSATVTTVTATDPMSRDAPAITAPRLPAAPPMEGQLRYRSRPGGVTVYLPAVPGAADYRVYELREDVAVTLLADGGTHVAGASVYCAGLVQHNQCDPSETITEYGPNIRVPGCKEDLRALALPKRVLQQVGVDGLRAKTTLVVEALDALCPFPGAFGSEHADILGEYDGLSAVDATYQGKALKWPVGPLHFPIRSESEIRAQYGSLILNGQRPAPAPSGGSPWATIGLPAPAADPKVVARAVIEVEPLAEAALPAGFVSSDFYESFSDPADQPRPVQSENLVGPAIETQNAVLSLTSKLGLYTQDADHPQFFVHNGVLRSVLSDIGQDVMGSNVAYPRRAFALPASATSYVHVTFEIATGATQRRYWWFHACGSGERGKTMVDGKLPARAAIVPRPSFMNPIEGSSVSSAGWNCLQIVPRGGSYARLAAGPYGHQETRAETDLRVVINPAVENPTRPEQLVDKVWNVSPAQVPGEDGRYDAKIDGAWYRTWNASKQLTGVMLDDQMFVEQRVKLDVYFNRERIVVYANDTQKLCNDFPAQRLTMAEAAIGVGHVFYHSYAERLELMRDDWIRTGQYQYLHNLPFVDQRSIDNLGVRENASLPAPLDEATCFRAQ